MSQGEGVPQIQDPTMALLQAIQGIIELMSEDKQERRAQHQIEERALQEDEKVVDLVEQERQVGGNIRGRGRNNFMQSRRVKRVNEDRGKEIILCNLIKSKELMKIEAMELSLKSHPLVEWQMRRDSWNGKGR
ncbi:uncharacterized protein E5676_scaffold121G00860 [Cucumis melo var. makuwa]|uniref:Uncharacterized protein n=1 Tax=Cucumis melo var. makuwa TaxID=1194695 RepID=A0A5D3BUV3_CUCMM|nr:uncharacterized protein E6C27_scaffold269G001710 [Cucumis melo var. makuwa]TYK03473.1 uncharacterized protein E5676_scaffold121G00860 [Cucumis melo var. makuwa]